MRTWRARGNALLGTGSVISSWALGFRVGTCSAALAAWMLGAAIVVLAMTADYTPGAWGERMNILVGLCLLISPRALSYADMTKLTANAVSVGVLVPLLAVRSMLRDTQMQQSWHERAAARQVLIKYLRPVERSTLWPGRGRRRFPVATPQAASPDATSPREGGGEHHEA